jgi:hypothetical protein
MSFLYNNRPQKAFQTKTSDTDSGADTDDTESFFRSNKGKSKSGNGKRTRSTILSASATTKTTDTNHALNTRSRVNENSDFNEVDCKKPKNRSASSNGSAVTIILSDAEESPHETLIVDDSLSQTLLALKKNISTSKQRLASVSATTTIHAEDIIDEPIYFIPTVKSAQERERDAAVLLKRKLSQSNKVLTTVPKLDEEGNKLHIKTRLGGHEKEWDIVVSAPFSKVCL